MDKILNHREADYDTLHPEETLKEFVKFLRDVKTRYEFASEEAVRCEQETQDILHYVELGGDLNAMKGFKAYKTLADARRRRRICKNEMETLEPVYRYLLDTDPKLPDKLAKIQGDCRKEKDQIKARAYICRTDILEECK